MDYVMMPVPEGLTRDVEHFLMETDMRARAADRGVELDPAPVAELMGVLNAPCRNAFVKLSEAALTDQNLTLAELARAMHLSEHETVGLVQELSELVWAGLGPFLSIVVTTPLDVAAGKVNWDERKVFVWKALADAVVAAPEPAEGA